MDSSPKDVSGASDAVDRHDLAALLLRCGIGTTFLVLGEHKLLEPGNWIMFVPTDVLRLVTSADLFTVELMLRVQGAFEILLGALLVVGVGVRVTAALASLLLAAILAEGGLGLVGARDVGLLGGTLALAFGGAGKLRLVNVLAQSWHGAADAPIPWQDLARRAGWTGIVACAAWVLLSSVSGSTEKSDLEHASTGDTLDRVQARMPIPPLPAHLAVDPLRATIGGKLFRDPRLSRDGTLSCASCHDLAKGGADGRRHTIGIDGQVGELNTPTVLNAALNFRQFWDGRAASLEEQAGGPIVNPKELGSSWQAVLVTLGNDAQYRQLFERAFPDGITESNVRVALAEFERTLLTPDAPFDRSMRGDRTALTPLQKRGYEAFVSLGCVSCHQGVNVGGNTFQTMGKMEDYFAGREPTKADLGRYNVTGDPRDKYKFKVPSLRNVALTAPYFHDGSAATLEDAVNAMARFQLGQRLTYAETGELVAFLESLTGRIPAP